MHRLAPADRRPVRTRRARSLDAGDPTGAGGATRTAGASARRRRGRAAALAAATVLLALVSAGCVGKTGRNDDYVAPGSPEAGPSGQVVPVED